MLQKALKIYLASIFLFLLVLNSLSYAQSTMDSLSPKVKTIVQTIAERKIVTGEYIGFIGEKSEQWQSFDSLTKFASTRELKTLTGDTSRVLRCYAFWALANKSDTSVFGILLNHLTDTVRVETFFGDVVNYPMVIQFYLDLVTQLYLFTADYLDVNNYQLDSNQMRILDSILISTPNNIIYTKELLLRIEPNENYYQSIKNLALSGNTEAMIALSKFKRAEDVEIILNHDFKNKRLLFLVIDENPVSKYKPLLKQYADTLNNSDRYPNIEWYLFYKLLLKNFDNPFASDIIFESIKTLNGDEYENERKHDLIFEAISEFPQPIYDSVLFALWEYNLRMNLPAFKYLWTKDSTRCLEVIKTNISDIRKNYDGSNLLRPTHNGAEETISEMLKRLYINDKNFAIKILIGNLEERDNIEFDIITGAMKMIKDEKFIPPLLNILQIERHDVYVFGAMATIISYENPEFNKLIMPALRENKLLIEMSYEDERIFEFYEEMMNKYVTEKTYYYSY